MNPILDSHYGHEEYDIIRTAFYSLRNDDIRCGAELVKMRKVDLKNLSGPVLQQILQIENCS